MIIFRKPLLFILSLLLTCSIALPASAQTPAFGEIWTLLKSSPLGQAAAFKPAVPMGTVVDPAWSLRTGIKKGVTDISLDEELFAAPDAAVLKNGYFETWPALLQEFREPSLFVDPGTIAGLARTKPYLIIPSGGLQGLSRSEFFKAGLAEYVRSGGVVICLAQQNGADFTALPLPPGSSLEAIGWQQDAGPVFRASSVQGLHALLSGTKKSIPDITTNGYFPVIPASSQVVLTRSDDRPTLITYSYGSGQVVAATIFSDFSHAHGQLDPDEKVLIRDIILWAKAHARTMETRPGQKLDLTLAVRGAEQGEASTVRAFVVGPDSATTITEETIKARVIAHEARTLAYSYTVPMNMSPGIYHIEYVLFDAAERQLSARAEAEGSWFSVGQPPVVETLPRLSAFTNDKPVKVQVDAHVSRMGAMVRLTLDVRPETKSAPEAGRTVQVRANGQEQAIELRPDRNAVSFDIPEQQAGRTIAYMVFQANGPVLARGSVLVPTEAESMVSFDKPVYSPGQKVTLIMSGLGKGEFTLMAPGRVENLMLSGAGITSYTLPTVLPAGSYQLQWKFESLDGKSSRGTAPLNIAGYRVSIADSSLEIRIDRGTATAKMRLSLAATQAVSAQIRLELRGPDGSTSIAAQSPAALEKGSKEVPISISFKPSAAGIWEAKSSVEIRLPAGPGLMRDPVTIAESSTWFDVGDAVLLGVVPSKSAYYDPSGPMDLTAYIAGEGKAKLDVYLDSKNISTDKLTLSGTLAHPLSISDVRTGRHTMRTVVSAGDLESSLNQNFVFGVRSPDLRADFVLSEPSGTTMPVGIRITNIGRVASGPSKVALYESVQKVGGALIAKADIPSLAPHASFQAMIEWPLGNKAGTRSLTAVVDPDNVVMESNKENNTVTMSAIVPELLVKADVQKRSFSTNEELLFSVAGANLTTRAYRDLSLNFELLDGAGKTVRSDKALLSELAPGPMKELRRSFELASLPSGTYRLRIQAVQSAILAAATSDITILPTLMLQGSLEGTPDTARLCMPFSLRYRIRNTGNLSIFTGSMNLEIRSETGRVAYEQQLPLSLNNESILIDKMDFPRGAYTITLKASALNDVHKTTGDFVLVQRPLTVAAPLEIKRSSAVLPRVLVRLERSAPRVQQAIAEQIVKQALEDINAYFVTVDTDEDFLAKSESNQFNTFVLFEADAMPGKPSFLADRAKQGQGVVIIGPDDSSRRLAGSFGFTFSDDPVPSGSLLSFSADSGIGLAGTLLVSGKAISPYKKGARALALFTSDKRPAVLLDSFGAGRVLIMPLSLARSAVDLGTTSLYSLLLRSAVQSVVPDQEAAGGVSVKDMAISSPGGPIRSRIVMTLPPKTEIIWTGAGASVKNNIITYDLNATADPQKLLCIYRPPSGSAAAASTEAFYDCGGSMISQGNVE